MISACVPPYCNDQCLRPPLLLSSVPASPLIAIISACVLPYCYDQYLRSPLFPIISTHTAVISATATAATSPRTLEFGTGCRCAALMLAMLACANQPACW